MSDDEPPVPEEVLTSAKDQLDEEEISVADNEEILHALSELTPVYENDRSYFVLGNYDREPIRRLNLGVDRLPVVVPQHEVRLVILVDGGQLAQSVEDFLVVRQRDRFVVELVLRTREDLFGDGRLFVGHIRTLSASGDIVYEVNYQLNRRGLLWSDLLRGKLLVARTCIVSYEH